MLEAVARGDLTHRVDVKSTDELGRLGTVLNTTIGSLKVTMGKQQEAAANSAAVNQVLTELGKSSTVKDAVSSALETVKAAFGWAYGSYWGLDAKENVLKFVQESGEVNAEFRRATMYARFHEGEGLSGSGLEKPRPVFRR